MAMQIAVIGSGVGHLAVAEEVGRRLAQAGCVVVTGGLDEVMAAAHRGAKEAGGTTIAILPGVERAVANAWADHVVCTGVGHARNLAVAASADAVVAVGGSWGTLTEIGFAMRLGRPCVIVEGGPLVDGVPRVASAAEAVEQILAAVPAGRR
ncbi:MAG: TIGR00725 family protein [Gaiella sp.]